MKTKLKLDWCSHEAALLAVKRWHYSRSLPLPPCVFIGVWEDEKFIGVVIFSRGASPSLLRKYGLLSTQGCELTRVALNKHISKTTRILSIAMKMLKKKNPKLRLIVSFADPNNGHHGGIYQGGNWIFAGTTDPSCKYYYNGKMLHSRQVATSGLRKQFGRVGNCPKPEECLVIEEKPKYRYLMPLDSNTLKICVEFEQNNKPKCATSSIVEQQSIQTEDGGAEPTVALQFKEGVSDVT